MCAVGEHVYDTDADQSPPGGADSQRRDEDATRHAQSIRPDTQEEEHANKGDQADRTVKT